MRHRIISSCRSHNTINDVTNNPLHAYHLFKKRLSQDGMLASFPEFKDPIEFLQHNIHSPEVMSVIKENGILSRMHSQIDHNLLCVKEGKDNKKDNYPHKPPIVSPYSYLPTIICMEKAISFIDCVVNDSYNNIRPHYYAQDFYSYIYSFYDVTLHQQPFVLFPTIRDLTLDDFIKTRAVPIGLVSVKAKPHFADGFYHSPLDIFMHDVTHARRTMSYNDLYFMHEEAFNESHIYTQETILPQIELLSDLNDDELQLRKMVRFLYFELLHELGIPPSKNALKFTFQNGFIRFQPWKFNQGNSQLHKNEIHPFIYFISHSYNKLTNGYYDIPHFRDPALPTYNLRTPELIAKAGYKILVTTIPETDLSEDKILAKMVKRFKKSYPNEFLQPPIARTNQEVNTAIELTTKYWSKA